MNINKIVKTDELRLPQRFKDRIEIILNIAQTHTKIEKIVLFGSCARQIVREDSDVDVALVVDFGNTRKERLEILGYIEDKIYDYCEDNNIEIFDFDLYPLNVKFWNVDKFSSIVTSKVKKEGLLLYDRERS